MQSGRVCDVCPLLLPASPQGHSYRGYISVEGRDFALRLTIPSSGQLKDARLECDWMLSQMLKGKEAVLQKLLQESKDEVSFLSKLKHILGHHMQSSQCCTMLLPPPPPPSHYTQLVADLELIGWHRVVHISKDFACLKIRTQDSKQREHVFAVHVAQMEEPPSITCDLPLTFKPSWSGKTRLCEVLRRFEEELSAHQVFWDVMDELDREAWVLEPERPSRACNYRRIVVCANVSLYLTVDPRRPLDLPEFRFLGPETVVGPIRHKMMTGVSQWDPRVHVSLKQNLENLLDLELPSPEAAKREGFCEECGICYSYQLDGVVPDMVCNNHHCNQPFHYACLLEWLQTLPTTRQSFGTLFGDCPYCNEQISIKLQR